MIKAVIFDLDGVLVGACEWHRIALNESLKEVCNYEISLDDHYKEFNGIPTKVKLKKLAEKKIISEDKFKLIEEIKQKKTIQAINSFAYVREEKIELLKHIKSKNIKLACYTNSIRETAELMLEKTGILKFFDLVVTNQDVKNSKPDPEGYKLCFKILNLNPEETIIIEDSENGFLAASLSKANVIRVKDQEEVNLSLLEKYL